MNKEKKVEKKENDFYILRCQANEKKIKSQRRNVQSSTTRVEKVSFTVNDGSVIEAYKPCKAELLD